MVLAALLVAVMIAYAYRMQLFGLDGPVRIVTVIAVVAFGSAFARSVGRATSPALLQRLGPGAAGTVGFLVRLATSAVAVLVAMRVAGIKPQTLEAGGAVGALIFGLAAQQTLSHVFAGAVLLTSGHLKVGDRVRVQNTAIGPIEGTVASVGLLYTKLELEKEPIMVPNNGLIQAAVVAVRSPSPLDVRARLPHGVKPSDVKSLIQQSVSTPTRSSPRISLEEVDGDEVTVNIATTPARRADQQKLADEILSAVARVTFDGKPAPTALHSGR